MEVKTTRKKLLEKIVSIGYQQSPFYRQIRKEHGLTLEDIQGDWNRVPVTQKRQMVLSTQSIVPPKYYTEMSKGNILTETTSGSTGQCLKIYWSREDMTASMLPLWGYRKKYYGIQPSDRYCYFYTQHNPYGAEPEQEQKGNGLGFSKLNLTTERVGEIYDKMMDYCPVWMVLQPGMAMVLARHLFENGVQRIESLQYIELTGEMLTEQNKKFIETAFGCPCVSQYGSYEVNSIAYECPEGDLHIMDENVYVEVFRNGKPAEEGEEGEIVVTSLQNFVMPFIRYGIGDLGRIESCSCPYHIGKVVKLTRGRKDDVIVCSDGETLSAYEFVKVFGCISEQLDGRLLQYQVEQVKHRDFRVHVVTDEKEEDIKRVFYQSIQAPYLKECSFQFCFHKQLLPEEATGKLRMFRSMIQV